MTRSWYVQGYWNLFLSLAYAALGVLLLLFGTGGERYWIGGTYLALGVAAAGTVVYVLHDEGWWK